MPSILKASTVARRRKSRAKLLRRIRRLGRDTAVGSAAREVQVLRKASGVIPRGSLSRKMTADVLRQGRKSGRI